MPYNTDEFDALPIWETRARLADEVKVVRPSDPTVLRQLADVGEMLTYIERYQNQPSWRFDPTAQQALNDLNSHLSSLESAIAQIKAAPDNAVSYAPNVASGLDAVSTTINRLPTPILSSGHLKDITSVTEQHKNTIVAALAETQRKADTANTYVDQLESKVTGLSEEIDRQESRIIEQSTRLDDALNRYGERYETESKSWVAKADEALSEWNSEADQALVTVDEKAATQRSTEKEKGDEHIASLETMIQDGKSLLDAVARKTISNQYAQYSWRQGLWATLWAVATVLLAVGGFVFLFLALREIKTVDTAEAILKGLASFAVLGAAAYAAAESSGHRQEARDAKRTQLDLNALEPAIARLDGDKQVAMRETVLNSIFNRPRGQKSGGGLFRRRQQPDIEAITAIFAEALKKSND